MSRRAARGLVCTSAAALLAVGQGALTGPAWAEAGHGPFNEMPGRPLGVGAALLLFVVVPLVILGGTAALVWLPGMARGARYRPQRGWTAPPLWFGGPPVEAAHLLEGADDLVRGGAHGEW